MATEKVETKNVGFVSKNVKNKEKRLQKDQEELDALIKEFEGEEAEEENTEDSDGSEEDTKAEPKDSEERTWKKRYGDLRKHSQETKTKLEAEIEALKESVEQLKKDSVQEDLPEDEAELKEWANKNPDAAKLIRMMAAQIAEEKYGHLEEELESLKVSQTAVSRDKSVAKIMKAHPDFEELQENDSFHDWVEAQPKMVQEAVYESSDPESVIWAIDRYKETLKPRTKKKDNSAAEAVETKGKTSPAVEQKGVFKESDVAKMDMRTYEKNSEAIEKAIKEGKFEYDLSGGAR